jgi:predicted PurR-regulated permease PerM
MQNDSPDPRRRIISDPSAISSLREHAGGMVAFATVLALLYFGRTVLIPFTLAVMLSLLIAPLARRLRRLGLGQTASVLVAVVAFALAFTTVAAMLGTQVLRMAASLPQYERTIQQKLQNLDEMTVGRLKTLTSEASRLIETHGGSTASPRARAAPRLDLSPTPTPIPVELHQPPAEPFQVIGRVLASVWGPIETTGIVLVVLVFVLLEQEALRDRFIRVAGAANIRLTTLALNDAGERLSRFFVSQFAVNLGVGVTIALGLAALGLPHAALWGTLAAVLRFVPYVGVWLAAVLSTTLAIAVDPGWSMAIGTIVLFVVVELIAGQAIEPHLYGHTTGLSPLSVIVAALFWSALWGPVGLILSTPLTLCLVVVGRHIKALAFLELLLGDTQALTLPQKFYQRALSGDADEIISLGRAFLKHDSFAAYCDVVLLPALHLGFMDLELGAISEEQQVKIRDVLVAVVSALAGEKPPRLRRHRGPSVLAHADPAQRLRGYREQVTGRWQGPLQVPPGSVMLCIGSGSPPDGLAAELLVRALRDQKVDARHVSMQELESGARPPGADPASIAIVYLVSAFPSAQRPLCERQWERLRQMFPGAAVMQVLLPGLSLQPALAAPLPNSDAVVTSFVQAVQICLDRSLARPEAA